MTKSCDLKTLEATGMLRWLPFLQPASSNWENPEGNRRMPYEIQHGKSTEFTGKSGGALDFYDKLTSICLWFPPIPNDRRRLASGDTISLFRFRNPVRHHLKFSHVWVIFCEFFISQPLFRDDWWKDMMWGFFILVENFQIWVSLEQFPRHTPN